MAGIVDLTDLDMWACAVPYGEFGRLRREAPVAWSPDEGSGFWSVSRYADIVAASRDVATFSSSRGVSFEEPTDEDMAARRTIIDTDPPEHTKLRKIVASTFSQRAVAVYEHLITGLTEEVMHRMPASGTFDFVDAVAKEVPIRVLAQVMGLPAPELDLFIDLGDRLRADLVTFAIEAERAGLDAVMVSEHVVLGPSADAAGLPANPRDYALPGNQDPATPWPSPLVLLSAIAAATTRIRLVASALISPLRHPLTTAKDLATLDRLSGGRLVVQPTVSWHEDEYAALGVPFGQRGEILDEQLEIWAKAWRGSPSSHDGKHYSFGPIWVEPPPARPGGPDLWFGGSSLHPRLIARLVRYGRGFNPLGPAGDLAPLAA